MKLVVVVGTLAAALAAPGALVSVQAQAKGSSLGSVTINTRVLADGTALAPGTYQVRLTGESPKPMPGLPTEASQYVEFVRGGKVAGRALATVIPASEIGEVADGPRPGPGASRVEMLKGNDYLRIWINRGGTNYLIHLPPAVG
jgi:hypothetical protein